LIVTRYGNTDPECCRWRFGSFRAQADAARKVLDSDEFNGVTAWFERDPCE